MQYTIRELHSTERKALNDPYASRLGIFLQNWAKFE